MLNEWSPSREERERLARNPLGGNPLGTPVIFRRFLNGYTEIELDPLCANDNPSNGIASSTSTARKYDDLLDDDDDDDDDYDAKDGRLHSLSWMKKRENTSSDLGSPSTSRMARIAPTPNTSGSQDAIEFDAQSLHFADQAMTVETQGARSFFKSKRQREIDFMANVGMRKCITFIEKPNQDHIEKDNRLCCCCYKRSDHITKARKKEMVGADWIATKNTETVKTNAFGEIEFLGYGDKLAKFVRVEMDTKMTRLLRLLKKNWEIEKPTLLISVTGGAKKCNMKARLKDVFKRGLKKAAQSPGAWIITGGTNAGVMKLVGEAVRDHDMMSKRSLVTIGVAPWGCVRNKECLINETRTGRYPATYSIKGDDRNGETFLDPNHSHFILVDNGTQHKFATEIELRTALEEAIGKEKTDSSADAVSVPVCLLVLDGGVGTLETVHSALKKGTPTVVIKGSGKVADILAYAVQNVKEREVNAIDGDGRSITLSETYLEDNVLLEIEEMVEKDFGRDDNFRRNIEWIKECTKNMDKISVFELDSKDSAKEVDLAILKALLKANKQNVKDQLRLALNWNRIDVAKMEIFTEEQNWKTGTLDDAMMMALKLDRVEFVQLFLDHGVRLKDFLTEKRLLELYNSIPTASILWKLLNMASKDRRESNENPSPSDTQERFKLADVGLVIRMLLGDFFKPGYPTNEDGDKAIVEGKKNVDETCFDDDSGFSNKSSFSESQQLFIWAVLLNRHEMSFKFWMIAKESSAAALFAMSVLSKMKKYTVDCEIQRNLQKNAEEYESRAIEVLNACYSCDEIQTQDNLIRNMPNWGSTSSILMAYHSDNKRFLAQTACQSLLNQKWRGGMEPTNNYFKIFLCTMFFPLIPCLIKFKDPTRTSGVPIMSKKSKKLREMESVAAMERQNTEFDDIDKVQSSEPKLSPLKDIYSFYKAPIVKFNGNVIFYFVFLALYSYIMLVKLEDKSFHFLEIVLIVWVVSIFAEEMRQLTMMYSFTFRGKLKYYFYDQWNILDIVTINLFVFGMILRSFMTTETMAFARIFLNINLITFFLRVLHIFSVNPKLGPMLVMISDMLKDLMWFVVILLVFVFAYAIASEAILYPNSELSWKLLYYLPRKAYWQMYGEIILDEIEGGDSCTNDPNLYKDYNQLRCPSESGKYFVPILLGIYVMLTSVMLLNLLIAMFSYTFQKIQERSDMHWCYQRFSVVHEYVQKPLLPPPIILFSHIILLVQTLYRCLRRADRATMCCLSCRKDSKSNMVYKRCCHEAHSNSAFRNNFDEEMQKRLVQWENIIADNHFSEKKEPTSLEGKVSSCNKKIDSLIAKVDFLQELQGQGSASSSQVVVAAAPSTSGVPVVVSQQDGRQIARLDKRMENIENQLTQFSKSFDWIMKSLQESNMATKNPKPRLMSLEDKRIEENERKIERQKRASLTVGRHLTNVMEKHIHTRSSPYPGTNEKKFDVPDEMVEWEVPFPQYSPKTFTSLRVLSMPHYADPDILPLSAAERNQLISYNTVDKGVNRVSLVKPYQVVDGVPMNPVGRTGMKGRGSLGRWGPNLCGDPIVTRWKLLDDGSCSTLNGKPQLEFVSVQRKDNALWAIPGAICEKDEEPWDILHTDFKDEVMGSLMKDQAEQFKMNEKLDLLAQQGKEIYKGYADDPRNTDNAWLETRVINYHDADGSILKNFNFRAGDDVTAVSWQTISSRLYLHGGHTYFLKLVADEHQAAF